MNVGNKVSSGDCRLVQPVLRASLCLCLFLIILTLRKLPKNDPAMCIAFEYVESSPSSMKQAGYSRQPSQSDFPNQRRVSDVTQLLLAVTSS